jgi:hypothetical protein
MSLHVVLSCTQLFSECRLTLSRCGSLRPRVFRCSSQCVDRHQYSAPTSGRTSPPPTPPPPQQAISSCRHIDVERSKAETFSSTAPARVIYLLVNAFRDHRATDDGFAKPPRWRRGASTWCKRSVVNIRLRAAHRTRNKAI